VVLVVLVTVYPIRHRRKAQARAVHPIRAVKPMLVATNLVSVLRTNRCPAQMPLPAVGLDSPNHCLVVVQAHFVQSYCWP